MVAGITGAEMKRGLTVSLLVLSTAIIVSLFSWQQYRTFVSEPLKVGPEGLRIQVSKGSTVRSVITGLDHLGVTGSNWRWRLLMRLHPVTIKAGEYDLPAGIRPEGLLQLLESGDVVQYRFTIIEGWTYRQLLAALGADPVLANETTRLDGESRILAAIDADLESAEGWFLPETYQFIRGDSDLDILKRSYRAMLSELESAWASHIPDLPLKTPYDLLTLASIVEKESGIDSERGEIAGVFVRRLNARWRLETDPTVIYGIGEAYDGDIRRRDLDTDTPYNTYTRFGLPPTPIALPGKSSIKAAANPADGTAMFFVASGSGGHVFSDTLEQHNSAVQKMLRRKP
jgi:UPF0755 protein